MFTLASKLTSTVVFAFSNSLYSKIRILGLKYILFLLFSAPLNQFLFLVLVASLLSVFNILDPKPLVFFCSMFMCTVIKTSVDS